MSRSLPWISPGLLLALAVMACTRGPEPAADVAKAPSPEESKPAGDPATGRMSRIARSRFATLTGEEIQAMKLYLDSR
jgi:hypothetical protein